MSNMKRMMENPAQLKLYMDAQQNNQPQSPYKRILQLNEAKLIGFIPEYFTLMICDDLGKEFSFTYTPDVWRSVTKGIAMNVVMRPDSKNNSLRNYYRSQSSSQDSYRIIEKYVLDNKLTSRQIAIVLNHALGEKEVKKLKKLLQVV